MSFIGRVLLGCLLTVMVSGNLKGESLPDLKGIRILICMNYFDGANLPIVKNLQRVGAEVRLGDLSDMTWDSLKLFNLLITVSYPSSMTDTTAQAVERFVKTGGGLLSFRLLTDPKDAPGGDRLLAPFGASLPVELIQDPLNAYKSPLGHQLSYAYTTRITPGHSVTAGVKGVWYNAEKTFLFHTGPLKVGPEWAILVSGEDSAISYITGGWLENSELKPGIFPKAPPIVAAREYGAGAVVLFGISPMELFYGQDLPAYLNIVMSRGDGVRPSGTGRLYQNAVGWLAGHARAAKELAQGTLPPIENEWAKADVPDWNKLDFTPDICNNPVKGVIGLHSTLSDGKSSPQQWIEAGKKNGLAWVAFTERLEDFSKAKWEELRKTCREASGPAFAALPGLDYADGAGDRWVAFGDFDWPTEKVFSPDGKSIIEPGWWFKIGCVPNGPYNAGQNRLRAWDYSMYDMWPVRTTVNGNRTDEAAEGFRFVQGVHDDPMPMSVDMVYDASELTAAAGRMCNYITLDQPVGNLTKFFRESGYYRSYRSFVSDGPVVTDWRAVNECRISGGKWYLFGTERYRVKLAVRSAAKITEVRIYDGPDLFRCFRPNREKTVIFFDVPHDQQRNLVAEITDSEGKRAVTGGIFIRDFLNWRFMCSDRGNSICDGIQTDADGPYLIGPTAPYQRKMTPFGIVAGYGTRHFNILPPQFDGGMRPIGMGIMPEIRAAGVELIPSGATPESRMEKPVCSRDGILQEETITGYFPGRRSAWEPKTPPVDQTKIRVNYRYLDITPRSGDPGVVLLEGAIAFLQPMRVNTINIFQGYNNSQPDVADHFALVTPAKTVCGILGPAFSASSPMTAGSYVVSFPSLLGSTGAIALDEGYTAVVNARYPVLNTAVSYAAGLPREMKAGESLTYRLVLMHGRIGEAPNTNDWETFVGKMGFRGHPAYEVKSVKAGRVKGTNFLLELAPADGGFTGTVTQADLPIRLPVRVANMNPNWTFAWFDLDRKEWYPSAVDRSIKQGYFTLDTRWGDTRFFAGHPVLTDDPELRIAAFSDARSEITAEVNNPGEKNITAVVRLNPALGSSDPVQVDLAPGEIKNLKFAWTPLSH